MPEAVRRNSVLARVAIVMIRVHVTRRRSDIMDGALHDFALAH
jgi:hypothetical protein